MSELHPTSNLYALNNSVHAFFRAHLGNNKNGCIPSCGQKFTYTYPGHECYGNIGFLMMSSNCSFSRVELYSIHNIQKQELGAQVRIYFGFLYCTQSQKYVYIQVQICIYAH